MVMSDIRNLSYASTQLISPAQTLRQLISPPETHSQIRAVVRTFLPIAERMPSILAEDNNPALEDLRAALPSMVSLCRAIDNGTEASGSWRPSSDERPKLTPYPIYAGLLKIGEQKTLSTEQERILANIFVAIWMGVPGSDDGRVPLSNLQHVFLEFRRSHLWENGLEVIDTSQLRTCYVSLKKHEQGLKERNDMVAEHIAPIRRLLGLSLEIETLIERRERNEDKQADNEGDPENPGDNPFEMECIQVEPEDADNSEPGEAIACFTAQILDDVDQLKAYQTAVQNAVPSDDFGHRAQFATSAKSSTRRKAWEGKQSVARDRSKSNHMRRAAQTLPNKWDRLSEYDLYVFWQTITLAEEDEFQAALALLLVALTGKSLDEVLDTQLKQKLLDLPDSGRAGRIYLCHESAVLQVLPPQPERKSQIEPELQLLLVRTVPSIRLPIVKGLWRALERQIGPSSSAWRGALFKNCDRATIIEQAKALLSRVKKECDAGITPKRIQRALFHRLADGSGDIVHAILIAGDEKDKKLHSGINYHCAHESDLCEAYLIALSRLLPEFQADLVPTVTLTQSKQTQRRIGSPYCPKLETIRRLSDELKSRFEIEMRQPIGKLTLPYIHNAYTLYTVLLVIFATGYRSVKAPLSRITDVDVNRGYMVIADKESDDWSHSRVVPLTDNFLSHWAHYLRHRHHVVRLMKAYLGEPDLGHVFFFLSTPDERSPRPKAVIPAEIKNELSPFSGMPLNVGRHYLRSEFAHQKLPASVIDAFMGHWVAGREPMGRFSTLAPSEYRAMLLPALEAIQAEMGWTPVRGLG
ncbi:MAG TPA: hypothetical protein DC045_21260 [Marinobacter adhaerens]|uniref:Tyr recombinase domain-containing protein n=1 Tax=Marinobacter adhaerens TaxID=1033846 RepID=A0A352IZA5_9GAMM|nr:hypothetical protein [Marinobacter adhaerens]